MKPASASSHRRHDEIAPGQRAESLVCLPETGDRAWYADREVTNQAQAFDYIAVNIEVHVTVRCGGRLFAIVDECVFTVHACQHEAATADVAGFRGRHGKRQPGGNACVNSVARRL